MAASMNLNQKYNKKINLYLISQEKSNKKKYYVVAERQLDCE